MNIEVKKGKAEGTLSVIPSKSYAHRILIASALGDKAVCVRGLIDSKDIIATIEALKSLGASFTPLDNGVLVKPIKRTDGVKRVFCDESGSTLRFLLPIISALGIDAIVDGKEGLRNRPIKLLLDVLRQGGAIIEGDSLPIKMSGRLTPGRYILDGSQSSQNLTGLLYALTLLDAPSKILLTNGLVSVGYVDITLEVLKQFGANIVKDSDGYTVYPSRLNMVDEAYVEGDYSSAAFLMALGVLTGAVTIMGLRPDSKQGDKAMIEVIRSMGGDIVVDGEKVVCKRSELRPINLDATDIPDLIPIISVCCSYANGISKIKGVDRLKIKESDRLTAIRDMLDNFGVKHEYENDTLTIFGGEVHECSGEIKGYNDHRIVMSGAVMGFASQGALITDKEAIKKSYPTFFEDLEKLGGKTIELY